MAGCTCSCRRSTGSRMHGTDRGDRGVHGSRASIRCDRGLRAATRSGAPLAQRHAGSRRHRGQHPPGRRRGRSWQERRHAVRGGAPFRLGTEKFMLDGRHTGTGGGNHVTLGGATPDDSPILAQAGSAGAFIGYWQHHPSLSYLFRERSSDRPRRHRASTRRATTPSTSSRSRSSRWTRAADAQEAERPWLVDRLLRNLLIDLTGNTHRAEFSIDKLYSPDRPTGRLGLVEFRALRDATARAA